MKNKGISIFTLIFIGILLLGIGIGIGYLIPKENNNTLPLPQSNNQAPVKDKTNTTNITNTTNTAKTTNTTVNTLISNTIENTTLTENTIANSSNPSEITSITELLKEFTKAVNTKDWTTVEMYSNANVVNELKKYNVTNIIAGTDTIQKNSNKENCYYCHSSYNIDYNGMGIKDLGLGYYTIVEKLNGKYVITAFGAASL